MGGVTHNMASDYNVHGNRTRLTHPDRQYFAPEYDPAGRLFHLTAAPLAIIHTMRSIGCA